MPDPEKLERLPPVMETSASAKSVEASESVKVMVAVSPALRDKTSDVTATVGLMLSTERVTELLLSPPSALLLPEALEKTPEATEITPSVKSVDDAERVKLREAVSPAFKEETSELMAMVGLTVSTVRVRDCQVSTLQMFL